MTIHGGKPVHEAESGARPSPFAPLTALVSADAQDVGDSLTRLASALGTYEAPARIHLRVLTGDDAEHWEVDAGSKSGTARRQQPKSADIHLVVRRETWLEIASGRLSPFEAVFSGRMRVGGDVELAKRIVRHLSDPSVPYVSPC